MRLAAVFSALRPLLDGTGEARAVAAALHGEARPREVARLEVYAEICGGLRRGAIEAIHAGTRAAMVARVGEEQWARWIDAYFREQPMRCFELNENAAGFANFVASRAEAPAWAGDLAALEWATWRAESAPDVPEDSSQGELAVAASVVVLRSAWDLLGWLAAEAPAEEPARVETTVVVWRDGELDACRAAPTDDELAALAAAQAGAPQPWGSADVVDELRAAGIFVGTLAPTR